MRKNLGWIARAITLAAVLMVCAGLLSAGEKKLMHCFVFTPIAGATDADWAAFAKATDELPSKIPGLHRVWHGKLLRNLAVFMPDSETRKKFTEGVDTVQGGVMRRIREYGVCMEMDDEKALKVYADHPAHREWEAVYGKVRQPGTTTFDIIGR